MKKVLLVLAALVLVASGVAAVSAYEAHIINVRAHVENAMEVRATAINFGTVFPEEWMTANFTLGTSDSFCADNQTRVTWISYGIFVEWKPIPGTPNYYPWLGDALYVGVDAVVLKPQAAGGNLVYVGGPPAGAPGTAAKWVMDAPVPLHKLSAPYNLNDTITLGLDVPVFEGYYNNLTDMLQADGTYVPKPSGLNDPTYIIAKTDPRWIPDGVDLGLDLKIQVTNIW